MGAWAKTNAARTAVALILFILLGSAQAQDVRVAPERISFAAPITIENDDENVVERVATFPSAMTSGYAENDVVSVKLLTPAKVEGKIPFVVILHYWGAGDERIERAMAAEMNRRGIGAALMALPYHLSRTPEGRRSGELALQPDPAKLRASMTQSVMDVRRTIDFLETLPETDSSRLGIAGISLGSLVTALSYAVEPRLKSAGFMLGGADFAHIIWHSSRVVRERDALRAKGYFESTLREELAPIEPLTYLKDRQNPRAFVVGGKYDTVIPPADTQKLILAMPGAKSLMLDTGHYGGIFVQRRIIRAISEFMEAEFKGENWEAPRSLYAPTVRIGAELSFESKLQVAAGVDLYATPRRDFFVSLLVSPKGPRVFGGYRLDKNLAVGVFGTTKTASLGVFWSAVL